MSTPPTQASLDAFFARATSVRVSEFYPDKGSLGRDSTFIESG